MTLTIVLELAASSQQRAHQVKHGGSPTCQTPSYPRLRAGAEPMRVAPRTLQGWRHFRQRAVLRVRLARPCRTQRSNSLRNSDRYTCHPIPPKPPASRRHTDPPAAAHNTTRSSYERHSIHNSRYTHASSTRPHSIEAACRMRCVRLEPYTIAGQSVCALCRHQACARRPGSTWKVRTSVYTSPSKLRAPQGIGYAYSVAQPGERPRETDRDGGVRLIDVARARPSVQQRSVVVCVKFDCLREGEAGCSSQNQRPGEHAD